MKEKFEKGSYRNSKAGQEEAKLRRKRRRKKKLKAFFWKLTCKGIISFKFFKWLFYRK